MMKICKVKVLQDSCNLEVVSDYCIDDEDLPSEVVDITHHIEQVTDDSKPKIKYSIVDKDLPDQLLEDTSNLEVVTDYSIDDEDLHHGLVADSTSNLTVDTDEVLGVTR